jgi:hypothetical protein
MTSDAIEEEERTVGDHLDFTNGLIRIVRTKQDDHFGIDSLFASFAIAEGDTIMIIGCFWGPKSALQDSDL